MTPVNLPLDKRANIVQRLPWADGMDRSEVETFARFLDPYQIEKDQTLFLEGDRKLFMVILLKGKIRIFKQDSSGSLQNLNTIGPGKILGEMALVDGSPRSASAVASEETVFLRMTQESFQKIQDEFPRLGMKIFAQISRLLSHRLRQTSGSLVEHMHTVPAASDKEEVLVGEQTMMNIGRRPAPSQPQEEESLPLPAPPDVTEGEGIPGDILMRRYLLTPEKTHDTQEIIRSINLIHRRLNKIDQWIRLREASSSVSSAPDAESQTVKGSSGLLKNLFR